jgi:hypothetical protein
MRRTFIGLMCIVVTGLALPLAGQASRADDPIVGEWSGTFDGDSTGKLGMTFTRDASKNLAGSINVTFDMGEGYTATFKSIDVQGNAVTLAYDSPGDGAGITLAGTLDGTTLKGTWKAFEPGTTTAVSSGGFATNKR